MSKQIWKPGALLAPIPPVLVTCGTMEKPNVFTAAWTGICNTIPPMTYISVRPGRYSYPMLCESGEFAINLTTAGLVRAADFCGVRSGRDTDKFAAMSLTAEPAHEIQAPLLAQSPVSLECRVRQRIPLGSHDMFLSDIVAVQVDGRFIDADGKLHLERCRLAAYAHGAYYELGACLGTFGYSVRKTPAKKRRKKQAHSVNNMKPRSGGEKKDAKRKNKKGR